MFFFFSSHLLELLGYVRSEESGYIVANSNTRQDHSVQFRTDIVRKYEFISPQPPSPPCHQLQVNSKGRQGSLALGGKLSRRNKISLMRDKLSCTRYTTAAETAGNASMTVMGQGNRDAILRLLFYLFVFFTLHCLLKAEEW